jgi:hypothetical protein
MPTGGSGSPRAWWVAVALLSTACVLLGLLNWTQWRDLEGMRRQIAMLRALMPGRTKAQVVRSMGPPDDARPLEAYAQATGLTFLVYKSTPAKRMNGMEDVWVLVDQRGRVIAVFYPEDAADRAAVDELLRSRPTGDPAGQGPGGSGAP